jgi:hypothetical protein
MSDLKSETRTLLELGRGGDEPSDLAVAMNRRKLTAKLGAAALATGAIAGSASQAAAASAGPWVSVKVIALCGTLAVGGAALSVYMQRAAPTAPPAASVVVRKNAIRSIAAPATSATEPVPTPVEVMVPERSKPLPHASASVAGARSIQSELELIRAAQKHLHRSEARAALTLLAEHARRFPNGALAEEREASRVLALCQLGDAPGTREQAQRFVQRTPSSPFVDRVRASCGLKAR